jgi:hypothetical protein
MAIKQLASWTSFGTLLKDVSQDCAGEAWFCSSYGLCTHGNAAQHQYNVDNNKHVNEK